MRRFQMRERIWSFGDDYAIRDASGHDAYYVDGHAFAIGNKLSFQDAGRREIAFIAQRLLAWGPTYDITVNGQLFAQVRKHLFTFLHCRFTVDVPGPNDFDATGNFIDMEYAFERGGRTVATVSKRWFALSDTYGVEILDPRDELLILASTVVIDLCCHADRKR